MSYGCIVAPVGYSVVIGLSTPSIEPAISATVVWRGPVTCFRVERMNGGDVTSGGSKVSASVASAGAPVCLSGWTTDN